MTNLKCVLASAFLLTIPFAAEADSTTTYTFESTTKVQYTDNSNVLITGILAGDTSPTTVTVPESGSTGMNNCYPLYQEALSTHGRYLLSVTISIFSVPPAGTATVINKCSLELKH